MSYGFWEGRMRQPEHVAKLLTKLMNTTHLLIYGFTTGLPLVFLLIYLLKTGQL